MRKPIRVALISHAPYMTGAERMLLNLALLLNNVDGVEPFLIIPGSGLLSQAAVKHGIRYQTIPTIPWYLFSSKDYRERLDSAVAAIRSTLQSSCASVVVINTLTNVAGLVAAVQMNIPSILWIHGILDSFLLSEKDEMSPAHDKLLVECVSKVVANSRWTGNFLKKMIASNNVEVIHNWTDIDSDFRLPLGKFQAPRRFSCLSSFDKNKGHLTLVNAAAVVRDRGFDFTMSLYGVGPTLNDCKHLVDKLGLRDVVEFFKPVLDPNPVYDHTSCLVNPSYIESFGMTIVEAMARKTPVIATKSGGPQEIIDSGKNGFLLPCGDVQSLVEHMITVLTASERSLQQMGEMGYQTVQERFTNVTAKNKFVAVIESVIDEFCGYPTAIQLLVDTYLSLITTSAADGETTNLEKPSADTILYKSDYADRARKLARLVDHYQEHPVRKIYHRFLSRNNLLPYLADTFVPLVKYSSEANLKDGYRLRLGKNLQHVPYVRYSIDIPKQNLKGIQFAMSMDLPMMKGKLFIELTTPEGNVIAQSEVAGETLDSNSPVQFNFPVIRDSERSGCLLKIYAHDLDVPLRMFEWHKYTFFGLGRFINKPFYNLLFTQM